MWFICILLLTHQFHSHTIRLICFSIVTDSTQTDKRKSNYFTTTMIKIDKLKKTNYARKVINDL